MAYHPFERICSLWLERVKHHFVIENLPIRYRRRKRTKYSPTTATTDFDLISYDPNESDTINLCECKSHINQTFQTRMRTRLLRQLEQMSKLKAELPFATHVRKTKRWVFGIRIAERIKSKLPRNVHVVEGKDFEERVLTDLILLVGSDPKIDPKDEVLSIVRLFWHFGILHEKFYLRKTQELLGEKPQLSAKQLRDRLGLITYKMDFCKGLLNKARVAGNNDGAT